MFHRTLCLSGSFILFACVQNQETTDTVQTPFYIGEKDTGIGYSLARTTIHSFDFSEESYTYIEEGDKELKTFSIEEDRKIQIPMIK